MINATSINNSISYKASEASYLKKRLEEVDDSQGIFGNLWNGVKEFTNCGLSMSDCESMLDKYNKGEIGFDEALEVINDFESKQKNATGLLTNILTGIGGIAVATAAASTGPVGWALAFAKGAPIGAALKAGLGVLDRATNDIENDELNLKTIAKDAISGAMTGATSAVSSGIGGAIRKGDFGMSVVKGVTGGAACGAMSGAASYMTDVAFGDEDFEVGELAKNTALSSATSALVGGTVGGALYGGASVIGTAGTEVSKSTAKVILQDSASSSFRKVLGSEVKELMNA